MFDIAWSELGVIAVVALVVIGPKDLPKVLRTVGQWTAKARAMAREFQSGLDDMVREAELDELRKSAKQLSDFSVGNEIKKSIDPDGSIATSLNETKAAMDQAALDNTVGEQATVESLAQNPAAEAAPAAAPLLPAAPEAQPEPINLAEAGQNPPKP
jgi:sec-independent protein translocase protein TatB